MRVIIINPWNQTITEAEHSGVYRDYYRLLSGPTGEEQPDADVHSFDIAAIGDPQNHLLFVDDEGLYAEPQAFFTMGAERATFGGRGVIARGNGGEDEEGATIDIGAVRASVRWVPLGAEVEIEPVIVQSFDTFEQMLARLEEKAAERLPLINPGA
jgi:hypothetical protein